MPDEFQALGLAAGQGVERLTEPQVTKPSFAEETHGGHYGQGFFRADLSEETHRVLDGHAKHVVDAFPFELHAQCVRLVALAFAFGAGHIEIAQKLHLYFLEAVAPTALAASVAAVEAEEPRRDAFRFRILRFGEELPDRIERADIDRRRAARRARERALIHHHDGADLVTAFDCFHAARLVFDALAALTQQISIKHFMDQRAFPTAADAGDGAQHAERNVHVDVFQIVLSRADDAQHLASF